MNERCEALEPLHSAWVDGELGARERARLGAHLQRCGRCRSEIHALRVTQTMLRSIPQRDLVIDVTGTQPLPHRRRGVDVGAFVARSGVVVVLLVLVLSAAAFVAGSSGAPEARQVAVPVDVFVADHLVRAVGGPVSTPALLEVGQ